MINVLPASEMRRAFYLLCMPISEVYNMDCMEYMRSIPDKFFELAVVDPPFGINAPNMTMGTNMNRKHGGYNGESVAQRLKKGKDYLL